MLTSKYEIFIAILALPVTVNACIGHSSATIGRMANEFETAQIRERQISAALAQMTAVTNVYVFTGTQLSSLSTVIFTGEYVTAVVPYVPMPLPGAVIIDGKGGVLLLGLLDNHCHSGTLEDLTQLINYGVTTAIGMAYLSLDICNALKG